MAEADPGPLAGLAAVPEVTVHDVAELDATLRAATTPFVVRGLAADWPLVRAGLHSADMARAYLLHHHRDRPFTVSVSQPGSGGRLFYDDAMAMNFRTFDAKLPEIFARLAAFAGQPDAPTVYLASIDVHQFFNGLHAANHIDLGTREPLASIWMGTRTRIAAHNDVPDNLAVVAIGHPRFADAIAHGQVVDMAPGDALYIPALWWHHVEGLDDFNVLVNYWWRDTPRWLGQPQEALNHALMAIRDLPADQKAHWRDMFDHYVFDNDDSVTAHIPEGGRGVLDPMTPDLAARLRAFLLRALSR